MEWAWSAKNYSGNLRTSVPYTILAGKRMHVYVSAETRNKLLALNIFVIIKDM